MIQLCVNSLDNKIKQIDDFIESWDDNDVKMTEMIHNLKEELERIKKNSTKTLILCHFLQQILQ
jgi:wobble nucleotide-excising tRNase